MLHSHFYRPANLLIRTDIKHSLRLFDMSFLLVTRLLNSRICLFCTDSKRSLRPVSFISRTGNVLPALICTHYPGHINLNIKLNAWMLSYILRETSISFFPESVRYYNSRYISLRPVKIHQRKQSHLRSHNTFHSSFVQKSFP